MKSPGAKVIRWGCKPALHVLLLLPALLLTIGLFQDRLGANPVETITHQTGEWGLRILLLSLAVTPLARLTRSGWLIQLRRLVGLYSFFYILLHFCIYLLLDLSLDFASLIDDIVKRKYITVGFAGMVILVALAVTSPIAVRRRMANSWTRLHRLVYAAAALGILHFLWSTKADDTEPFVYGIVFLVLMLYRIHHVLIRRRSRPPVSTRNVSAV